LVANKHLKFISKASYNSFTVWAGADDIAEFKSENEVAQDNFCNDLFNIPIFTFCVTH
jgi:hypothetical protein